MCLNAYCINIYILEDGGEDLINTNEVHLTLIIRKDTGDVQCKTIHFLYLWYEPKQHCSFSA